MKRFQGMAVVLILGVIVVIATTNKRTKPSTPKNNESIDQASTTEDANLAQPAQPQTTSTHSRSMAQETSPAKEPSIMPTARMASRTGGQMAQHELSPISRNISADELRSSDVVPENWKLVTSIYAVPQAQLAQANGTALGEQNGFTFFEAGHSNLQEGQFSSERPLVVYDPRLQTLGVITGTVQIDVRKGADVASLLQQHGATVQHAFPGTGTYYITSQEQPFNLIQFKNSLEQDSRVNQAEVEIVSRRYGKQ